MRQVFFFFLVSFLVTNIYAQKVVYDFESAPTDSNYWIFLIDQPAKGDYMNISYVNDPVYQGSGAMRIDWRTSGWASWGDFVGAEQWYPESDGVYDLSGYDSLTFRYYVATPITNGIDVVFRLCLLDCSDAANGTSASAQTECEKYYSFIHILTETTPGWHYWSMPLKNNDSDDGHGFAQKGWGGVQWGNYTLDLDMIKGFVWELVVNQQTEVICEGSIIFDQMELHGLQSKPLTFFNGKIIPTNLNFSEGRAGSCVVTNEQSSNPVTHSYSLKWTTPGQWDGPVWQFNKTVSLYEQWAIDTLKFKIKAPAGVGDLRIIFQDIDTDGIEKADYPFEAAYVLSADAMNYDDTWKTVQIPLRNFNKNAGVWDDATSAQVDGVFDTTKVWRFKIFRTNDSRWQNQIVYLDEIWTGSPVFDVMPPEAPAVIQGAVAGNYNNLVLWEDVLFEEGEIYNVYASTSPITDIASKYVDHIGYDIAGGTQSLEHPLLAPATDQDVTYYYAIICKDAAGNQSPLATTASGTTNLAKGIPVIHETAPANFTVDGELGEWSSIPPFVVSLANGTTHVPDGYGYTLSGDNDFSFKTYLAVDENNLYVGVDVEDDILYEDPANDLVYSYLYDGIDLFLGLYDWRGESHTSYEVGAETDYHFRFNQYGVILDQSNGGVVLDNTSSDFSFVEKFPSGYKMEAKIPFSKIESMLGTGFSFKPQVGMRIPVDLIGNDNDATEPDKTRECVLTYSYKSNDNSWADVSVWSNTWIGNAWTTGVDDYKNGNAMIVDYKLNQNYPNPFNPSTSISYSVKNQNFVTLKVYDCLGSEVKTLVNEIKAPGSYRIQFDASQLPSGIYFCKMSSGNFVNTIKMMMVK
ncbi:MAG: T9SS C-terminal target domain-containing protein [Ignavibacteriales bacterium]|nr:MAG: T9SS C-terminal target domain-containing protein [Ignavibacteriales bacterium]